MPPETMLDYGGRKKNNYEFAWVTNTDILFDDPQTLKKMISVLEKDSTIGVVSPRVFTPSGMETNRNLFRPSVWDLSLGKHRCTRGTNKIK